MTKKVTVPGFQFPRTMDMPDVIMKNQQFSYGVLGKSYGTAEMNIYGYIGELDEVDYSSFQNKFREQVSKYKEITLRIHSGGGSVFEGLAIYDLLRSSNCTINVIVEGMAASMASVIALAGESIQMTESAFFMVHAVKGGGFGDKKQMGGQVELIENCERRLTAIFEERTNASLETITDWFDNGKDNWLNAVQCLELSLCDEIIKPIKKRGEPAQAMVTNAYTNEIVQTGEYSPLEGREDWTFEDWQERDKTGLKIISMSWPEQFAELANKKAALAKDENDNKNRLQGLVVQRKNWSHADWINNDPSSLNAIKAEYPHIYEIIFGE